MRFSLLVEETGPREAVAAARAAAAAGLDGVWAIEVADDSVAAALGDAELPARLVLSASAEPLRADLVTNGAAGWVESLAAILARLPKERERRCWVLAGDETAVTEAAHAGVGAVLSELDDPDAAAPLVAAYEAALTSPQTRPLSGRVNAACAALVLLPSDLDSAVGVLERYRQADVDEVLLRGSATADPELLTALIDEFDDEEVRLAVAEKARRLAPAISAIEQRALPPAAGRRVRREGPLAGLVKRHQQAVVGRISDRLLEVLVGNRAGLRLLVSEMAARYRPEEAGGFTGVIELTLTTRRGPQVFSIDCGVLSARARPGASPDAKLRVEAGVADFLRLGTGELRAPDAVLDGRLNVRGDFALALRIGELFGGPPVI
jgi:putative sterol carrier protein